MKQTDGTLQNISRARIKRCRGSASLDIDGLLKYLIGVLEVNVPFARGKEVLKDLPI